MLNPWGILVCFHGVPWLWRIQKVFFPTWGIFGFHSDESLGMSPSFKNDFWVSLVWPARSKTSVVEKKTCNKKSTISINDYIINYIINYRKSRLGTSSQNHPSCVKGNEHYSLLQPDHCSNMKLPKLWTPQIQKIPLVNYNCFRLPLNGESSKPPKIILFFSNLINTIYHSKRLSCISPVGWPSFTDKLSLLQ